MPNDPKPISAADLAAAFEILDAHKLPAKSILNICRECGALLNGFGEHDSVECLLIQVMDL